MNTSEAAATVLGASQAKASAIELAQIHKDWPVMKSEADRKRAIERVQAPAKLLRRVA